MLEKKGGEETGRKFLSLITLLASKIIVFIDIHSISFYKFVVLHVFFFCLFVRRGRDGDRARLDFHLSRSLDLYLIYPIVNLLFISKKITLFMDRISYMARTRL